MKLILATWNKQKQNELKKGLNQLPIIIEGLSSSIPDIDEVGQSFQDNAKLKVNVIRNKFPKDIILGEDSGLAVDYLNGFPGVKTARFISGTDAKRALYLMEKLKDQPVSMRQCAFHSIIYLHFPDQTHAFAAGRMQGWINRNPSHSIEGYQSVFQLANGQFLNQLAPVAYFAFSHRQQALRQAYLLIKEWLEKAGDCYE
ncbi:XTP/dITP diphosphohydrolase [Amphibacillus marinus]|uniref:XTP/dITP diphosphohydrolase n=1 Tax=Amphibacillus marinus TaxID=872970 RepID=A0A1H8JUY7_9BACI|nr:non-canonical purine NTP pyrophosphatase [Amphibacillus marinus]SEN84554.1 XTP/dITP diphosphohydrolase [Amphibacillus marinus]